MLLGLLEGGGVGRLDGSGLGDVGESVAVGRLVGEMVGRLDGCTDTLGRLVGDVLGRDVVGNAVG